MIIASVTFGLALAQYTVDPLIGTMGACVLYVLGSAIKGRD